MRNSIKQKILNFLTQHQGFQFGGSIEDFIRTTDGHKASNASRRCRELEDEGKIESQYVTVPGVANKVVQYRIKSNYKAVSPIFTHSEACCYSFKAFKVHGLNCKEKQLSEKVSNQLF